MNKSLNVLFFSGCREEGCGAYKTNIFSLVIILQLLYKFVEKDTCNETLT